MQLQQMIQKSLRVMFLALILIGLQLPSIGVEAARVTRASKKVAEIQLGPNDDLVKGDLVTISVSGKTVGKGKITRIKGRKAYARLKGKAPKDAEVFLASSSNANDAASFSSGDKQSGLIVGALLGIGMDSQDVSIKDQAGTEIETVAMSGMGFTAKAYADLEIADELGLIGRFGLQTFNNEGASKQQTCGSACTTKIMYITADILVRYTFVPGTVNPYIAGGLGVFFPMSKSSDILDENKIASTTVFLIGGGVHIKLSNKMYVPVSVEYGLFPPSNDVSTNYIGGQAGIGWVF